MFTMEITSTKFNDALILMPKLYEDTRGYFFEGYNFKNLEKLGVYSKMVQVNRSVSNQGVLRGLHYQIKRPQGKLVSVLSGEIFDVIVDLRKFSPTFGMWEGYSLSSENKKMVLVPPGFAHGFYTKSENADIQYMVTDYYSPKWERTLLWNDPDINIVWPTNNKAEVILSKKDREGQLFENAEIFLSSEDLINDK
jgi:dTDP-4-dehydrorhamnose 3,5-epimerase